MKMADSIKLEIARAQLGTALSLFIQDKDPYSVHALACGGTELVEGLVEQNVIPTLSSHILETYPEFSSKELKRLRNRYWNAIKHFYSHDRAAPRDDDVLMAGFEDSVNDVVLFMGWHDYMMLTRRLPVEVQVFQAWWFAQNEGKLAPDSNFTPFRTLFPDINEKDRRERKRWLRRTIEKYRKNRMILGDARTEPGPLIRRA